MKNKIISLFITTIATYVLVGFNSASVEGVSFNPSAVWQSLRFYCEFTWKSYEGWAIFVFAFLLLSFIIYKGLTKLKF